MRMLFALLFINIMHAWLTSLLQMQLDLPIAVDWQARHVQHPLILR